ncbi:MAG: DUF47 domain-containing protein [Deltaproteobacteria bacterium]|nr:DUF47 domain-containing protein [Deltaproteobacteria bacterium]
MGILESLLPREKLFFELFAKLAQKGVEVCETFEAMLADMGNAETHVRRIKTLEHEADEVTHRTVEAVHRTFVTPIDRDDIHKLASRLDDVIDLVDAAAARMELYEIRAATEDCRDMSKVLTQAARLLPKAVAALETSRKSPKDALDVCIEINRLENEGDTISHRAIARLFREEQDVRTLMKWKEIYENLEAAIDRCEDVANLIEGIVIEQG